MFKRTRFISFLLFLITSTSYAQLPQQLNFRTLTEKDGLSGKKISSIVQDKNGLIWIGSYNGLNRFDGNRIKAFYTDDSGIPFGEIRNLQATETGLWICTPTQLFFLQTGSEKSWLVGKFINAVIYKNGSEYNLVDGKNIYALPTDGQTKNNNFRVKPIMKRAPNAGFNNIIFDKQNQPWSFLGNKIFRLNEKDFSIVKEYATPGLQLQMIYFDLKDRCWVATWGKGAFLFDRTNGSVKQFNIEDNKFVVLSFSSWKQMDRNFLVLSSDNSMILVDETNLQYRKYDNNGRFLSHSGFSDNSNNLWLACDDGVRQISQRRDLFTIIPVMPPVSLGLPPWIAGVYSIKETAENFWVSKRYLAGIYQYDKNWHLKNYWPYLTNSQSDIQKNSSREAFDFLEHNGLVYVTTDNGMYTINSTSKVKLRVQKVDTGQNLRLRNIEKENDSTWWIRSYNSGIYIFNPKKGKFVRNYPVSDSNNVHQPVHYMLRTKKRQVFVTTYNGLYELNSDQNFTKVLIEGAPSEYMMGMAEDKNGILWIAGSNGMFAYDPLSRKVFKSFNAYPEMGFCYRVTVDDYNNIWFNCQQGYWCWVQSKEQMLKFGYYNGLPDNRQEAGVFKAKNGAVYAGANDAIVKFNPAAIIGYHVNASAIITDVLANNFRQTAVAINDSTQMLDLKAGTYDLSVNFSIPDYETPGKYDLLYKLTPGNKNFSPAEKGVVNFNSLKYGDYIVTVKGRNNLTGSFSKSYFLILSISPHWYETIFFKIALFAIFLTFVWLLLKRRINKVRTEAQFKQKIAESEMNLLRSQMNPHFIFNSLNSIENFIFQNEKRLASDYLIKFSKLIRTILDTNRQQLIPFTKDMQALRWYTDLEQIRFPQKFSINIQTDKAVEAGNFYVPPMIIQPFIENAIVHGVALSRQDGHQINILVTLKGEYLEYIIEDDGIGMARSAAINQLNKPGHKSVGLEITKERIRLHNKSGDGNDVIFTDKHPTGTRVSVKIKVKNHYGTKSNSRR